MIPVYSATTYASIVNPEHMLIYCAIRDFYEAYIIYTFMQLLIQYLGGQKQLIIDLEFKVSLVYICLIFCLPLETDPPAVALRPGQASANRRALPAQAEAGCSAVRAGEAPDVLHRGDPAQVQPLQRRQLLVEQRLHLDLLREQHLGVLQSLRAGSLLHGYRGEA